MHVPVAVAGRRGMLRDLVEHVVDRHDLAVVDAGDPTVERITVHVDPDTGWHDGDPAVRHVVLRSRLDDTGLLADLRAGADAVFGPDLATDDLVRAVHAVADGGCFLAPTAARRVVDLLRGGEVADPAPSLTPRELDILLCVAQGLSVKQTARQLGIAPKTVENLQSRMFRKLGVRNRAQAVAHAHSAGLLPDGAMEHTARTD